MRHRVAAAVLCCVGLAGCGLLPAASPTAREFETSPPPPGGPGFVRVELDARIAKLISSSTRPGLTTLGADVYRPSLVLKPGDTISVAVYEVTAIPLFNSTGGLQGPTGANAQPPAPGGHDVAIPAEVVEQDGRVPIPFGGSVHVAGLTPAQAGVAIEKALAGRATNPQVVVTLLSSVLNTASVSGDVNHAGLVPLTIRGERVLDVIAAAGGPKSSPYDTDVEMVRGAHVAHANMQELIAEPRQNLHVRPADSITLVHNPRSFAILGSALKVSQIDFNTERVTLAEAIARSGGLNDTISSLGDVYLMHYEPLSVVRQVLPPRDPQLYAAEASAPAPVPVAYHLDLRGASGYFISQNVQIHDKDVILVANAESVQFSKVLAILKTMAGIYYDIGIVSKVSSSVSTLSEGGSPANASEAAASPN